MPASAASESAGRPLAGTGNRPPEPHSAHHRPRRPPSPLHEALAKLKGERRGRVWPVGDVRTAFENAVAEAKVDGLHFHDLRHSFASWFVMKGRSLQALQTILGHQDIKMTLRYAHLAPDHLRSEMTRAERAAQTVSEITQAITHEPAAREVVP